jgi:replicative superfamily II helicase
MPPPSFQRLRDWQTDLITNSDWKLGKSSIVLVPTSGGKTVAADVAIAQLLAQDSSAKVVYAVPFVALASEKYSELAQRFFRFEVRPFYHNIGGPDFRRGNIAVCTYEKAHSLLNAAQVGRYGDRIKLIVIDEIHILGDEGRGAVVEALIVKALFMNSRPRVIGLTATLSREDALALAEWIDGFCYFSEIRPSAVKQFLKTVDGDLHIIQNGGLSGRIATLRAGPGDLNHVMDPIRRLFARSLESTVLIFVNTRNETLKTAQLISSQLYDGTVDLPVPVTPSEELLTRRKQLVHAIVRSSGGIDENMKNALLNGIGIHHAGLLLEERKIIEEGARNKVLSILVATTTLSAGVNIHSVDRVFIMNIYRWTPSGDARIPASVYTQMVGRAGRTTDRRGEAFIFAHSSRQTEIAEILKLSQHEIPNIVPHLRETGTIERFFLQCLSAGFLPEDRSLESFWSCTFRHAKDDEAMAAVTNNLVKMGLIKDKDNRVTLLGRAISTSSLSIEEGLLMAQDIRFLQKDICFEDELHLLYLCVSPHMITAVKPEPYNAPNWLRIIDRHRHVIKLITKIPDNRLDRMQDLPMIRGGLGRVDPHLDACFDRIYIAVIMKDLIDETPMPEITRRFKIDRGTIQSLQMQCATFAAQTAKFCELLGAGLLAAALNRFRPRLDFGVRSELLGLLVLPSCTKEVARVLVSAGITSPVDLAELTPEMIAVILKPNDATELTESDLKLAAAIHSHSVEYTESLARLESLEERAVQNMN